MTNGLTQVKMALVQALESQGLAAVMAFSPGWARHWAQPVAAVGLRTGESREVGLGSYLGTRTDPETGASREIYGKKLTLELSVDLYAPADSGAEGCDQALETLHRVLMTDLPSGLKPAELKWEEVQWSEETAMFLRKGSLSCQAWFTAETTEEGVLLRDFILKGIVTT